MQTRKCGRCDDWAAGLDVDHDDSFGPHRLGPDYGCCLWLRKERRRKTAKGANIIHHYSTHRLDRCHWGQVSPPERMEAVNE